MDPQHRNLSCQQICLCHVISSDRSERSSRDKRHTPHLGVVDFLHILWGQRSLAPALCDIGLGLVFLAFLQPSHIFPVSPTSVLMQHKHYVRFTLSCLKGTYRVSLRDNISKYVTWGFTPSQPLQLYQGKGTVSSTTTTTTKELTLTTVV